MVVLGSGAGVQAAAVLPAITLQPGCGLVGTNVTVTGSAFANNANITVTFDPGGSPVSSVQVTPKSDGSFTATITVPTRPQRGAPYQVVATQPIVGGIAGGQITASANFSLPCPSLVLKPNCGSPGDPVAVHGAGFPGDIAVPIQFTPPAGGKPLATPFPAQDGTFDVSIVVPQDPAGTYTVTAIQIRTQVTARAQFQIPCAKAAIMLVPKVGPPGTVVKVTGTGFPVGAVVKLSWSQGIPLRLQSITIDSTQGFQLTLLVYPHDELGKRRLSAGPDLTQANAPLFNIASADFLVVPGSEQPRDFSWRH